METLRIALDWSPNTNHTPLFLARQAGLFEAAGLAVEFLDPTVSDYARTPGRLVSAGEADLGIGPSESVLSYADSPTPMVAVAALLQRDTSALLARGEVTRPRDLDGARYASYAARLEDAIVRELVVRDGGRGELHFSYPEKFRIWPQFLAGEVDLTWIFLGWEGLEVDLAPYRVFRLAEQGIPYGYTPVLFTRRDGLADRASKVDALLACCGEAARRLHADPGLAAGALIDAVREPELRREDFLVRSQRFVRDDLLDATGRWGTMEHDRWQAFVDWVAQRGIFELPGSVEALYRPASRGGAVAAGRSGSLP